MHLLYLDDSGAVSNAHEQNLVLGGVSVFEAQSHWITQQLDTLAENIDPEDPTVWSFTPRKPTLGAAGLGRT